ncbi:MAG TPA: hypothetical protein VKM93_23890 [Terriglobia bacterium]|nr:hypothetical protein [Terriglobia bacterium]
MNRKLAYSLCLLALALCWGALPAFAGTIPIRGTLEGDSTLTPTGTPNVYVQNFTGDGDDTTFGSFTALSMSTIDFSNPPNIVITDSTFSETFGNGTLFGTSSGGKAKPNGNGTAAFIVNLVITGGTGFLAGDTGEVTLTGLITLTSPTTVSVNGSYTGSLTTTPEPSAAILMGTALMAMVLGAAWRRSS